jgi:hypothetical protein
VAKNWLPNSHPNRFQIRRFGAADGKNLAQKQI